MEFHSPNKNFLLAALPAADLEHLRPRLELCLLTVGQVVSECGETPEYAYFPTTCIVSMVSMLENGNSAEISVVGNEGVVGISLFMGGENTSCRVVVQASGYAYKLHSKYLKTEFAQHGALMQLMLRYTQAVITQVTQTAVCYRHHTIDQQYCRWLLLSLDRQQTHHIKMTQIQIANMLGVRRESVTEAALKLQKLGVIEYSRGNITVLNRAKLEQLSCECYAVVKKETARLFPVKTPDYMYANLAQAARQKNAFSAVAR